MLLKCFLEELLEVVPVLTNSQNSKFMSFKLPPLLYNEKGDLRTVGFELEFSNVNIEKCVEIIQELYGGEVQKESRFSQKVVNTRLGAFTIEFDLTLLTEKGYKKVFDNLNIHLGDYKFGDATLEEGIETMLENFLGKLFPYEIASPPVPCTQLDQLELLREALYQHKAEGTESFPTNAFGTHINIELPDIKTETILKYLQAFILLYPWLLEAGKTDLARKISPFIDPYPEEYAELILSPAYHPSLDILIDDYHRFNPDRNRPLDMYPLFAFLRKELILSYADLGKVKPRNTFHYRLPNSSLSVPDWTLAQEWNNWVRIEKLAYDTTNLVRLSKAYLNLKSNTFIGFDSRWIKVIKTWLS